MWPYQLNNPWMVFNIHKYLEMVALVARLYYHVPNSRHATNAFLWLLNIGRNALAAQHKCHSDNKGINSMAPYKHSSGKRAFEMAI